MKTLRIVAALSLAFGILVLAGCKEKGSSPSSPNNSVSVSGIDLSKPIAEIKAAAEKMDTAQLKAMAEKCIAAVKDKESMVSKLMEQQKSLPLDKMATDAQKIMEQVKDLQTSITKLQDIFKVYYDALAAKGGDTSGLQMP